MPAPAHSHTILPTFSSGPKQDGNGRPKNNAKGGKGGKRAGGKKAGKRGGGGGRRNRDKARRNKVNASDCLCTKEYAPVCAELNGRSKTYSNKCAAVCVDAKIVSQGECSE